MATKDMNEKLCNAAEAGSISEATTWLKNGADIDGVHCTNGCRQTALMKAVVSGHVEMVEFLLEAGASVDPRDSENKTALEMAKLRGHQAIIAMLEAGGVDRNVSKVVFCERIGDRLRQDVYDFAMLERITMIRASKFGEVETTTITGFSAIEDKSEESVFRRAFNEHKRRGGATEEARLFPVAKLTKNKIPTQRPE